MIMSRREYPVSLTINGIEIEIVIIDSHYEIKHSATINDELILKLTRTLNKEFHEPVDEKGIFKYFVTDEIELNNRLYKLIWLLEEGQFYLGVINAYRNSK